MLLTTYCQQVLLYALQSYYPASLHSKDSQVSRALLQQIIIQKFGDGNTQSSSFSTLPMQGWLMSHFQCKKSKDCALIWQRCYQQDKEREESATTERVSYRCSRKHGLGERVSYFDFSECVSYFDFSQR